MDLMGGTLVHPDRGTVETSSLTVENGRIHGTGRPSRDPGQVIDCDGLFIMPGLIDMHVHTFSVPNTPVVDRTALPMDVAYDNLGRALRSGVTSIRDLGAPLDRGTTLKRDWIERRFRGARPFVAGPMLSAPQGHGTSQGVARPIASADEMRTAVRELVVAGVDVIKMATVSASRPARLGATEIRAGCEEAARSGIPVAIHAHFQEQSIRDAVEGGCTTLEHGTVLHRLGDSYVADLRGRGVFFCPTLLVLKTVLENAERLRSAGQQPLLDAVEEHWQDAILSVETAYRLGVPVIAGTDAGAQGIGFDSVRREIALLHRCGLSAIDAIAAATWRAACSLGRPDLGRLAPGALADLVVLARNPFEDLSALDDPVMVLQNGRQVLRT